MLELFGMIGLYYEPVKYKNYTSKCWTSHPDRKVCQQIRAKFGKSIRLGIHEGTTCMKNGFVVRGALYRNILMIFLEDFLKHINSISIETSHKLLKLKRIWNYLNDANYLNHLRAEKPENDVGANREAREFTVADLFWS